MTAVKIVFVFVLFFWKGEAKNKFGESAVPEFFSNINFYEQINLTCGTL